MENTGVVDSEGKAIRRGDMVSVGGGEPQAVYLERGAYFVGESMLYMVPSRLLYRTSLGEKEVPIKEPLMQSALELEPMERRNKYRLSINGRALKVARYAARLSQDELGRLVGVVGSTISAYETGKMGVKRVMVERLAGALNIKAEDLLA